MLFVIEKIFLKEIVIENYVLGTQKNHLSETFLLSTKNICFG